MLNGRVYGSRRASEAAEREKEYLERLEPAFIEWGSSNAAAGVSNGSLGTPSSGAGDGDGRRSAADDDDGGGMAWVKRRREERQRRAREEKERQMQVGEGDKAGGGGETEGEGEGHGSGSVSPGPGGGEAGGGLTSSQSSQTSQTSADMLKTTGGESKPKLRVGVEEADLQTPATNPSELPPHSPAIHVSPVVSLAPRIDVHAPPASPTFSSSHDHDSVGVNPVEISRHAEELGKPMIISKSPMTDRKTEKQAMVIPSDKSRKAAASASVPLSPHRLGFIDPFADANPTNVGHVRNPAEKGDEDEYEDEEGEEDVGDEDSDDSNDDDEDFDDNVVRCVQHKLGFAEGDLWVADTFAFIGLHPLPRALKLLVVTRIDTNKCSNHKPTKRNRNATNATYPTKNKGKKSKKIKIKKLKMYCIQSFYGSSVTFRRIIYHLLVALSTHELITLLHSKSIVQYSKECNYYFIIKIKRRKGSKNNYISALHGDYGYISTCKSKHYHGIKPVSTHHKGQHPCSNS